MTDSAANGSGALTATYRVQLNATFTLIDLLEQVPYLHALGVSHLYLSPVFEAMPGSMHGYDVTDPFTISRERGGEEAFAALDRRLRDMSPPMGMVLDIVPNHMAFSGENVLLFDVLARGPDSDYWDVFDLWVERGEKITLPLLGGRLEDLVAAGEVRIERDEARGWLVRYWEHFFPVRGQDQGRCREGMGAPEILTLLESQHYRLAQWTTTREKIDFRRFFDISGLIGVRVEDPEVFALTHRKLFAMMEDYPSIVGVRVDHVDGLLYPGQYLRTLSEKIPLVWVEKILMGDEDLPADWPVAGTTGYEFIARVNDLFTDPQGFEEMLSHWQGIQGRWSGFEECVREGKLEALRRLFPAEIDLLVRGGGQDPSFWCKASAALPVYRTYAEPDFCSDRDREIIRSLDEKAGIKGVWERLSPEDPGNLPVLSRWQQLTGPAMAKGLEDTAHYRFTPLLVLNEVGCEARTERPGAKDYCRWLEGRSAVRSLAMNCASTHDTKRGEDARARLAALADMPGLWKEFYAAALALSERFRGQHGGQASPSQASIHFYFQTLLATLREENGFDVAYRERIRAHMLKAAREAKIETSWMKPAAEYEKILENYVSGTLEDAGFCALIAGFARAIARHGAFNALSSLTLRLFAPGVPDIYQGAELWKLSLVDPDNRRPVDFKAMSARLAALPQGFSPDVFRNWRGGEVKLWLTRRLLTERGRFLPLLCGPVAVEPLAVRGGRADNLFACAIGERGADRPDLIVLAALHTARMDLPEEDGLLIAPRAWAETRLELPPVLRGSTLRNLLTGTEIVSDGRAAPGVARLMEGLPVAVYDAGGDEPKERRK